MADDTPHFATLEYRILSARRILVTGASGFVGRALLRYLRDHCPRHTVVPASRQARPGFVLLDSRSSEAIGQTLQQHAIDVVVHLAGCIGRADFETHVEANLKSAAVLFDACATHGARVLLAGSAAVYGAVPVSAPAISEEQAPSPCNDYGLSKLWQEQLALARHRQRGLDVVATRIGNAFGAGQHEPFAIPRLLRLVRTASVRGERCYLDSAADTVRDFIHVDDLCRTLVTLTEDAPAGEVFNVGSGVGTSMRDVVRIIAAAFDMAVEFRDPPADKPPPDIPWQVLDVTRVNRLCAPARTDTLAMMAALASDAAAAREMNA